MSEPYAPVRLPSFGLHLSGDDGHREAPRHVHLGDDTVPCRWWHPDMSPACARCGSYRMDLHDGEWVRLSGGLSFGQKHDPAACQDVTEHSFGTHGGLPWSAGQRVRLGLPVAEQWWHDAAGWSVPARAVIAGYTPDELAEAGIV